MPDGAYALIVLGGLWLCLWERRPRWLGLAPLAIGACLALTARPPDLLVSADGRHAAVRTAGGELALLRDRAGGYVRDMWGDATAAAATDGGFAGRTTARDCARGPCLVADCSSDACIAEIRDRGQRWRLLATLSRDYIDRAIFEPACAAADIAISDRRLPHWCTPRWLKLDRAALGESGAAAIWLSERRIETVGARLGDHPWMLRDAERRPAASALHLRADVAQGQP